MIRKKNDHRDFYGLVALLQEGYIRFTGPIVDHALNQAYCFQCYSQGEGQQQYKTMTIFTSNEDSYLFIGPKGLAYFHQRSELRRGWIAVTVLALIASIISGITVSYLTDKQNAIPCEQREQ
jgi:hypothetical protein